MSKVRIVYKPDSTIAVIRLGIKSRKLEETELQWLDRVFTRTMDKLGFTGYDYEDVNHGEIPTDRSERNAWEGSKGQGIKVNKQKAKKIADEKLINIEMVESARTNAKNKLKAEGKID